MIIVKKYSKSKGADLGTHNFEYLCEGQLRYTGSLCGLVLIMVVGKSAPHTYLPQGFTMSLNCHACEKGLSFLFDPLWAWLLPHIPFGSMSVLLFLIFRFASGKPVRSSVGSSEILVKGFKGAHSYLQMGRHSETVELQLSCPSSIKTKFPQDFHRPSHSVRNSWVRFGFIANFIFSFLLSSLFLNSKRLPSSGTCLFFFKVKKAPLIGNMSYFFKVKKAPLNLYFFYQRGCSACPGSRPLYS